MEFFIGIVPPKEIYCLVNQLRGKWDYGATEPHITLKSPEGLRNIENWIKSVEDVVHNFNQFDITINGVGFFNRTVLYYKVQSEKINDLHFKLVNAVSPSDRKTGSKFELNHYVPHLTIMKHKRGYKDLPLDKIATEAKESLRRNYIFQAKFVRLYIRDNSNEHFKPYRDIYFSKSFEKGRQ